MSHNAHNRLNQNQNQNQSEEENEKDQNKEYEIRILKEAFLKSKSVSGFKVVFEGYNYAPKTPKRQIEKDSLLSIWNLLPNGSQSVRETVLNLALANKEIESGQTSLLHIHSERIEKLAKKSAKEALQKQLETLWQTGCPDESWNGLNENKGLNIANAELLAISKQTKQASVLYTSDGKRKPVYMYKGLFIFSSIKIVLALDVGPIVGNLREEENIKSVEEKKYDDILTDFILKNAAGFRNLGEEEAFPGRGRVKALSLLRQLLQQIEKTAGPLDTSSGAARQNQSADRWHVYKRKGGDCAVYLPPGGEHQADVRHRDDTKEEINQDPWWFCASCGSCYFTANVEFFEHLSSNSLHKGVQVWPEEVPEEGAERAAAPGEGDVEGMEIDDDDEQIESDEEGEEEVEHKPLAEEDEASDNESGIDSKGWMSDDEDNDEMMIGIENGGDQHQGDEENLMPENEFGFNGPSEHRNNSNSDRIGHLLRAAGRENIEPEVINPQVVEENTKLEIANVMIQRLGIVSVFKQP